MDVPSIDEQVIDIPTKDEQVTSIPSSDEQAVDIPSIDEQAVDIPSSEGQAIDIPSSDEQAVDVPSIDEQVIDIPTKDEQVTSIPSSDEQAVDILSFDGQAVDIPSSEEQAVDVPSIDEQAISIPSDVEQIIDDPAINEHSADIPFNDEQIIDISVKDENVSDEYSAAVPCKDQLVIQQNIVDIPINDEKETIKKLADDGIQVSDHCLAVDADSEKVDDVEKVIIKDQRVPDVQPDVQIIEDHQLAAPNVEDLQITNDQVDDGLDEDKNVDITIVEDKNVDMTIVEDEEANYHKAITRTRPDRGSLGPLINEKIFFRRHESEEISPVLGELPFTHIAPSRLNLQTSNASWEEKTPTNANRHSFGEDTRYSLGSAPRFSVGSDPRYSVCSDARYSMCSDPGSLESSGSDIHRILLERIPSFQVSVSGPEDDSGSANNSPHRDISCTKTPTNNPSLVDQFPSPQLRIRRSFPRSRPVSGDPLSNYSVIPRRKDSYFPPHLLNYGEYYSDSEDDRSCSVTTSQHDESEGSEEDYFSDNVMERQTANSLYFMAYEVKRRLSTIPAGAAGSSWPHIFNDVIFHGDQMSDMS